MYPCNIYPPSPPPKKINKNIYIDEGAGHIPNLLYHPFKSLYAQCIRLALSTAQLCETLSDPGK